MHDDALKELWRAQKIEELPPLPDSEKVADMKSRVAGLKRTLFWRDCRENIAAVIIIAVFCAYYFYFPAFLARLGCIVVILSCVLTMVYPAWRKRRVGKATADASLMESLGAELRRVEVEIALLRSVHWWYILPLSVGPIIFFAGTTGSRTAAILYSLFVIALDVFIYWMNQVACRKSLLPMKRELELLLGVDESAIPTGSVWSRILPFIVMMLSLLAGAMFWAGFDDPSELPSEPGFDDISAFSERDAARVDEWLQEQVSRANYPSLSVAIVRDGEIVYQGAFGFEDISSKRKAGPETSYHVASVTKVFTTSLAVLLQDQGVIDLDEPAVKYLPAGVSISRQPEVGSRITLRQLASHTSGLPRGVPGRVQSVEGRYELEPQRLYDLLGEVTLESEPGTEELYSNFGMGLLGHVLECAAGKPFEQLLREMICEPLGLEGTAIQTNETLRVATGYGQFRRFAEEHSYRERLAGSGGLVASAPDLAKFLAAQMKPGHFSAEMLTELHTPTRLLDGTKAMTALGWGVRPRVATGPILKKNGGRNNCSAWIGFAPEYDLGVVVLANSGDPDVDEIGYWLLDRSVPGGYRPVTKHGYARVAPFTGVRWEGDQPTVQVQGRWARLVSVDGIPVDTIMTFSRKEFGERAHKRFAEDLVELLSMMGHDPEWEVTLGLEGADGQVQSARVRMTFENRERVRE